MIKEIMERIKQGYRTIPFPFRKVKLSERYLGLPEIHFSSLTEKQREDLYKTCDYGCFSRNGNDFSMDIGKCVFCGMCSRKFPEAVKFSKSWSMAASSREDLILRENLRKKTVVLRDGIKNFFGRSLNLRQVSAGGCNACEADCNVLNTPAFDMGRFGIQFAASPRHADGLLITGPVTKNMETALKKTYEAVPGPKVVIAVGACAISGGIYAGLGQIKGIPPEIKVDLYIPGCPPHPMTILDGMLRFIGRIK